VIASLPHQAPKPFQNDALRLLLVAQNTLISCVALVFHARRARARATIQPRAMLETDSEVFRSAVRSDCHERAFMLSAVGIASAIHLTSAGYVLTVDASDQALAQRHLLSYDAESRAAPAAAAPMPLAHPNAWQGCVVYVAVLLGVGLAVSNGWWRLDAFDLGELDAAQVKHGQWWRAWTALTLHLDGAHLAANLTAGIWFGYLAARQIGSGTAWLLTVTGAALANLLESQFGPSSHRAVGASTAVFTALGLLVSHAWRRGLRVSQRWAMRWAPLVAGAVLLGWFGSAGEGTDIVAHALGFLCGCTLGAWAASPRVERALSHMPQWLAGAAALASIGIAWECALLRG
jgi:rhomboid protease GluP